MKKQRKSSENYILLPVSKTRVSEKDSPTVAKFLTKLSPVAKAPLTVNLNVLKKDPKAPDEIALQVLDSIDAKGAKLVSISNDKLADFRFSYPGLRIIPEKFYRPAVSSYQIVKVQAKQTGAATPVSFTVVDQKDQGIAAVNIVVFTDFGASMGASGVTDSTGKLTLKLNTLMAERIYIYSQHTYWGYYKKNVPLTRTMRIPLQPIALDYKDCLRYFYDTPNWSPITTKLKVGIIDTGIGPHKDIRVAGGKNMVRGENEADYNDNGEGHGTHVSGIIGAYGDLNGVAAGVEMMNYRVFPKGEGASNFDIMKAIDQAIKDKCDLINMSLGEAQDDEAISSYIKEAYNSGILCFAANGNDNRGAVSFPAAYSLAIAVSAMGRKGTFPNNSTQTSSLHTPYGDDKNNYIADFSNTGPETDLTAPGVGIISTFPNDRYAVMDGTSMACPAVTGMAARILSEKPEILNLSRNQTRADEMVKYLAICTKLMGFGANFEGKGMLCNNDELHP